jgi:metal-sulfur cluster biosynthetic enzyme
MAAGLEQRVLERIDSVQDPCSLAQAVPIGIAEMGMVIDLRISEADEHGRHDVELVLKVTAPGCMYVPFMDRSIRAAVADLDEVGEIATEWEANADWSPAEIAAPARERIAASRRRRLREHRERVRSA